MFDDIYVVNLIFILKNILFFINYVKVVSVNIHCFNIIFVS